MRFLFIAARRNSCYTFFPVHVRKGFKSQPGQRLLNQKNTWKHWSRWVKPQPGWACMQPLKLQGAQQLEDRQGKLEIAQLKPLQTMFDMLFIFFYRSLLPRKWKREVQLRELFTLLLNEQFWMSKNSLQEWKCNTVPLKKKKKKRN